MNIMLVRVIKKLVVTGVTMKGLGVAARLGVDAVTVDRDLS